MRHRSSERRSVDVDRFVDRDGCTRSGAGAWHAGRGGASVGRCRHVRAAMATRGTAWRASPQEYTPDSSRRPGREAAGPATQFTRPGGAGRRDRRSATGCELVTLAGRRRSPAATRAALARGVAARQVVRPDRRSDLDAGLAGRRLERSVIQGRRREACRAVPSGWWPGIAAMAWPTEPSGQGVTAAHELSRDGRAGTVILWGNAVAAIVRRCGERHLAHVVGHRERRAGGRDHLVGGHSRVRPRGARTRRR